MHERGVSGSLVEERGAGRARRWPRCVGLLTLASVALGAHVLVACSSDDGRASPTADAGAEIPSDAAATDGNGDGGASDGGRANATDFTSGTRLRARVQMASATGVRAFVGWHDSQEGIDCSWAKAEDGTIRCLPIREEIVFADDACMQPLVVLTACQTPPKLVSDFRRSCSGQRVYQVGAEAPAPATVYVSRNGQCSDRGYIFDSETFHALTPVAADRFVSATVAREARGPRMAVDVLRAADGAVDARSVFDTQSAFRCRSFSDATKDFSCAPLATASPDYFADATCVTSPLGQYSPSSAPFCDPTPAAVEAENGNLFKVTGKFSGTSYEKTDETCEPVAPARNDLFIQGAPVAADFVATMPSAYEGGERVQLRVAKTPTGERLIGYALYDQDRKAGCSVRATGGGKGRCVSGTLDTVRYLDADCTKPVAAVVSGSPPPTLLSAPMFGCADEITWKFYVAGARVADAQTIYTRFSGQCADDDATGLDLYAVTEDPGAAFPEITLTTE